MTNPQFSFLILTLNEELNLPRLLNSIRSLQAKTYVLDSGSTDGTLEICKMHGINVKYQPFENHPKQWDIALRSFDIKTPWVICLDADQRLSAALLSRLSNFKDEDHQDLNGIYFNRKNYFKGKWIRFGGFYPKYLLKMFRYRSGYSDLTEHMDHRFQVPGKTSIWKTAHLIEENLKENQISFWITKHDRYSSLLAEQELRKKDNIKSTYIKPKPWRSPNERNAWLKNIWWHMPLYIRPLLYFSYRFIFRMGFLDGKTGVLFHFLQGFWFRLIVDMKIEEMENKQSSRGTKISTHFIFRFLLLFSILYAFHLAVIGLTTPGGLYLTFADQHLNYIASWREFCISSTTSILEQLGYQTQTKSNGLSVKGHSGFRLIYSCLGYGVMSAFSAFVMVYPAKWHSKITFLTLGLLMIQILNICRLTMIALYYTSGKYSFDHHLLFNCLLYGCVALTIYFFVNTTSRQNEG
ncbi:MAG: glycosyltransferase [Bacteroidota bacterium]